MTMSCRVMSCMVICVRMVISIGRVMYECKVPYVCNGKVRVVMLVIDEWSCMVVCDSSCVVMHCWPCIVMYVSLRLDGQVGIVMYVWTCVHGRVTSCMCGHVCHVCLLV